MAAIGSFLKVEIGVLGFIEIMSFVMGFILDLLIYNFRQKGPTKKCSCKKNMLLAKILQN